MRIARSISETEDRDAPSFCRIISDSWSTIVATLQKVSRAASLPASWQSVSAMMASSSSAELLQR